jgi:hypothetical protein
MKAYHGSEEIKRKYVERMQAHIAADELVRGARWNDGKGCAIGCTLNKYNHKAYETELGLPEWLAILEDEIFENVSVEYSKDFPLRFLQAIPVGADAGGVGRSFSLFVVKSVRPFALPDKGVLKAVDRVIELFERVDEVSEGEWKSARRAASAVSVAASAVSVAASAAAAVAAYASAAYDVPSAAYVAPSAVFASVPSASYVAASAASARTSAYEMYAEELLKLLGGLKAEVA